MIYEYAIEPELFATWCRPLHAQTVDNNFGLGTPRILSTDMKKSRWKSKVFSAFESWVDTIPLSPDDDKKKAEIQFLRANITELIQGVTEYSVQRPNWKFQPEKTWIDNALEEHRKYNFHALLCEQNVGNCADIISKVDFERGSHSKWLLKTQKEILSNPVKMAKGLEPLLRMAKEIIFIDPYFRSNRRKWRRSFQEIFQVISTSYWKMSEIKVEIHASRDIEKAPSPEHFKEEECEKYMPQIIPSGLKVKFVRWSKFSEGEELHNRYILTNLGGVKVDPGFDERASGSLTEFILLGKEIYKKRWNQYSNGKSFKLAEDPFAITGTKL